MTTITSKHFRRESLCNEILLLRGRNTFSISIIYALHPDVLDRKRAVVCKAS